VAALEMLRSVVDFQQIQSHSRSRAHPLLLMRYRRNGLDRTRYGISTGRKVGSAVVRNGIRRRLRTLLHRLDAEVERGYDVLLVARPAAAGVKQAELDRALRQLLRGAALLPGDASHITAPIAAPPSVPSVVAPAAPEVRA
jgi:ribonuclease P protein component